MGLAVNDPHADDEDLRRAMADVQAELAKRHPAYTALDPSNAAGLVRGGKRLRAQLLLMVAAEIGGWPVRGDVITAAAIVELLHLGTLVHDDVMDAAVSRRGSPTLNALYGDTVAGYAGVGVLAAAAIAMEELPEWVYVESNATAAAMCDGQFAEVMAMHNPMRSVDAYMDAIRGKTGALFGFAAYCGARLAGAPAAVYESCRGAGTTLGVAYQIIDDVLDMDKEACRRRGKTVGTDLRAGVFTLPVLEARQEATAVAELLGEIPADPAAIGAVVTLVHETDSDTTAVARAEALVADALARLTHGVRAPFEHLRRLIAGEIPSDARPAPLLDHRSGE